MMGDADIVKEFLVESYENLDRLDRDLLELEKDPTAQEILASIFRTIHTIKGTCGFLGFNQLETVAHAGENLLSRLRDGVLQLNEDITTALLKLVDSVREMLFSIEARGNEGERDDRELIATLTRLLESGQPKAALATEQAAATEEKDNVNNTEEENQADGSAAAPESPAAFTTEAYAAASETPGETQAHPDFAAEKRPARRPETIEAQPGQPKQPNVGDTTIRVDVSLLDQLMNLVGDWYWRVIRFCNSPARPKKPDCSLPASAST